VGDDPSKQSFIRKKTSKRNLGRFMVLSAESRAAQRTLSDNDCFQACAHTSTDDYQAYQGAFKKAGLFKRKSTVVFTA
jgi:hypothetical protein